MTDEEMAIKLVDVENRAKSNTHRLDKLEKDQAAITRLATAVEVLAKEQSHQSADVKEIKSKVDVLEKKPGNQWDNAVKTVLATVISLVAGYIFAKIGIV